MVAKSLLGADIFARDDLRQALAEHDFASVFALIKKWGGLSQNKIASACCLTPGKVSTITNGTQRVTSFDVICRIADGLQIPGRLLGLAPRPWEESQCLPGTAPPAPGKIPAHEASWRPDTTVDLAAELTRSDLVMDRRTVARALTASAVTGASLLDPLEGWLKPAAPAIQRGPQGRIGTREMNNLEQAARTFRLWDHRYGGGLRRKAVLGQLSEVSSALEERQSPSIERRLYVVMAHLAGLAATMAWDSGLQRRAQDYYALALRSAHAGGDTAFGANVLAGMARQMLYRDQPQDAVELVRLAQEGSRGIAGPRVRAMLYTREAWAMSAMGREAAFRRATAQAEEALTEAAGAEAEPYWIAYFDESELAGVTGGRLLDLARHDAQRHAQAAADRIREALAGRGPEAGRSWALDRIGLAECCFLAGDVNGAVEQTNLAVDAAQGTQSGRVRTQLGVLYPHTVGHSASAPLREARHRIRGLLAS
ncbi:hypothetical protein ACFU99_20735 [Streptomyces sp. NPDC057654]|uniref:hypothetical protein n=1 Tax=Streptomyces sp. NPDC057654 TaxID=3346196 RepID=UPI0036821EA1